MTAGMLLTCRERVVEWLGECRDELLPVGRSPERLLAEYALEDVVEFHGEGMCWIGENMYGHWLTDRQVEGFCAWLEVRGLMRVQLLAV